MPEDAFKAWHVEWGGGSLALHKNSWCKRCTPGVCVVRVSSQCYGCLHCIAPSSVLFLRLHALCDSARAFFVCVICFGSVL